MKLKSMYMTKREINKILYVCTYGFLDDIEICTKNNTIFLEIAKGFAIDDSMVTRVINVFSNLSYDVIDSSNDKYYVLRMYG